MCVCFTDYSQSYLQSQQVYPQPPAVPDGSTAAQTSQPQPAAAVASYASYQAGYQYPPTSYPAASSTGYPTVASTGYPAAASTGYPTVPGYGQSAYPTYGVAPTSDASGYAATSYPSSGYVSSQSAAAAYSTTATTTQVHSTVYRTSDKGHDTSKYGHTLRSKR